MGTAVSTVPFASDRWLYEGVTLEGDDLSGQALDRVEVYESTLKRVTLCEATLRRWVFEECRFVDCDLSMAMLDQCVLQSVEFEGCKLVGVDWTRPSKSSLSVSFERCSLRLGNLAGVRLRETKLLECDLRECDFTGADCTGADLRRSNLTGALLGGASLQKADLRETRGLDLDPEMRFKGARVSTEVALKLAERMGLRLD